MGVAALMAEVCHLSSGVGGAARPGAWLDTEVIAQEPFRMLIMDSATSNFRVDFSGRGELADR